MNDLGLYLHIPNSKRCKFRGNHRLLLKHWFNNHPSPSWQLIEEALFQLGEYDVLKQVQEKYSSLQEDPLSKLFIGLPVATFLYIRTSTGWCEQ